jgi:hypothetical protein
MPRYSTFDGHQARQALDGESAVRSAQDELPDVVLLGSRKRRQKRESERKNLSAARVKPAVGRVRCRSYGSPNGMRTYQQST